MTMLTDISASSRLDHDYVKVAQVSAIGSLADTILRELISIQIKDIDAPRVAVQRAASIFRMAATELNQPRSIWESSTEASELFHFSVHVTKHSWITHTSSDDNVRPWFEQVAEALESVSSDSPTVEALEMVRREFSEIASQTMRLAAQLVESRHRA